MSFTFKITQGAFLQKMKAYDFKTAFSKRKEQTHMKFMHRRKPASPIPFGSSEGRSSTNPVALSHRPGGWQSESKVLVGLVPSQTVRKDLPRLLPSFWRRAGNCGHTRLREASPWSSVYTGCSPCVFPSSSLWLCLSLSKFLPFIRTQSDWNKALPNSSS